MTQQSDAVIITELICGTIASIVFVLAFFTDFFNKPDTTTFTDEDPDEEMD